MGPSTFYLIPVDIFNNFFISFKEVETKDSNILPNIFYCKLIVLISILYQITRKHNSLLFLHLIILIYLHYTSCLFDSSFFKVWRFEENLYIGIAPLLIGYK